MRIPINMGVKGRVTATLTNTETGERKEVKGDNLILNHYLDWAMERGLGILGTTTFNRCYIGTGDTPPQPGDTTFVGTQLAMSGSSVLIKDLAPPSDHIELIKSFPEIGVGNVNQLALTPDNEILLVGNGNATPTLKAFKIDKSDWSLTELAVPAFDIFDPELGSATGLSCGGDYLFVGLNYAPWGKLFKRVGDDFLFISDVPELSRYVTFSDISPNGKYLVVCGNYSGSGSTENVWVYKILEDGSLVGISHDITGECESAKFSPDSSRLAVANRIRLALYNVADSGLEQYYLRITTSNTYARNVCWLTNNKVAWFENASLIYSDNSRAVIAIDEDEGDVRTITWSNIVGANAGSLTSFFNGVIIESGGHGMFYQWGNHLRKLETGIDSIQQSRFASIAVDVDSKTMFVRQNGISLYKLRSALADTSGYARQWTFPAGVGTGTVNRIGLQANSGTGANGNNRHVAQIVLPEPLEKTEIHQLDVIWEIEVENPGVWEGVIPGGSRDGSNLAWRVTINEEQFYNLVQTGYRIPANWFGVTGTPNVRIGTSNEESDLVFDRENLRGEEIQYISSTAIREVNPYVPGSLKRTIRLFLEVDQGNGQIGEIVFGGSQSVNSLARITFDPPLDKPPHEGEGADPYRIYLDLEFGWQRGESDA